MTRLLSAFGKAASFTARGAAVTFGSTIFSCFVACNIEKGANRMIYKYYPHKFANVEAASGITQEELDFVKFYYGTTIDDTDTDTDTDTAADKNQETEESSTTTTPTTTELEAPELLFRYDSYNDSSVELKSQSTTIHTTTELNSAAQEEQETTTNTANKFWTEGEDAAAKALFMIPMIVPRQEIMACSITA